MTGDPYRAYCPIHRVHIMLNLMLWMHVNAALLKVLILAGSSIKERLLQIKKLAERDNDLEVGIFFLY